MSVDLHAYWEHRLASLDDDEAVGYAGLGRPLNRWMSRVRDRAFRRAVGPLVDGLPARSALDVGSGTGAYIDRWRALGVSDVTGSDIAEVSVRRLTERFPGVPFVRFSLGTDSASAFDGRFGAISAMDVLFHVLDDDEYRHAFRTLFELLEPGGLLVFTENFLRGREQHAPHQRSRTKTHIEQVVRESGFTILRRRPLFFLLNHPHDTTSRLHRLWWRALAGICSRSDRAAQLIGAALYPLELVITDRLHAGPSTELMLCQRCGQCATMPTCP